MNTALLALALVQCASEGCFYKFLNSTPTLSLGISNVHAFLSPVHAFLKSFRAVEAQHGTDVALDVRVQACACAQP